MLRTMLMTKYGNATRLVSSESPKKELVSSESPEKEALFGAKLKTFGSIYSAYVLSVLLPKTLILRIRKC